MKFLVRVYIGLDLGYLLLDGKDNLFVMDKSLATRFDTELDAKIAKAFIPIENGPIVVEDK